MNKDYKLNKYTTNKIEDHFRTLAYKDLVTQGN